MIHGANALLGGSGTGPATRDIAVENNIVGLAGSDGAVGAAKGLVINGATGVDASGNRFKKIEHKSLIIGTSLTAFGASGSAPMLAPAAVSGSNLCGNWLNTTSTALVDQDKPASQVAFDNGIGSTGNRFPNGSFYSGNIGC